ncbi:MAG: DNA topoisomerase IV subunit A [Rhodospirillaceae bacterium]|jgi:topoisomerase IV subunit A|nr:DNA topoisomerase IV subunit A [Rhodospirillaceae bacterium]MBT5455724.1 DNA topoisomerase IV subunit A [Rhodospirillaceae bacterium]
MAKSTATPETPKKPTDIAFEDALGERYLAYALSTITSRSLPDVRDGLKPVHRRLLFAMRQLRLDPNQGFKKCARVVGDVIGKYHPHGDTAVYDAMVRMAQEFAVRYPLVEGQGNFGNVDGDSAAAMRYTEARLTDYALAMLEGLDEDAVDFRENYDGTESEPALLPGAVPNLLANGSAGIAVGMATSIPPHNLDEICQALTHLIKFPKATIDKLLSFMPGPDFPTGGVLVETAENIRDAYRTGRGGFRLRARWEVEQLTRGQWQIVVTEIPYQIQKSRLVEKIAELMQARKLPMLEDIRDESAEDIRLILEPRNRSIEPEMMMEALFATTDLETRVGLNLNVLDSETVPRVMDLRESLQCFLDHRHDVLVRRTNNRLEKIAHRLEVLAGYMIVFLKLDEVIAIIREEDDPKTTMMKRWKLSEIQAEAILNMRLRSLRKLEEIAIREEIEGLETEQKALKKLLRDEKARWSQISDEIADVRKRFGAKTKIGARRTEIGDAPSATIVDLTVMIEREPITVICSHKGWIRAAKGHVEDTDSLKFKDGDRSRFVIHAETTDKLLMLATNGRFYTLGCDKLPSGRGHGEPVRLMVDMKNDHDVVGLFKHVSGRKLIVASSDGRGFVVPEDEVVAQTRNGKLVLNVSGDNEARACSLVEGDTVAVIGENHKLVLFPLEELPELTRGRGVKLQSYKDGGLSDIKAFTMTEGLTWKSGDRTRTETDLIAWVGKRSQAGRLAPKGFPRSNQFS